MRDARRSGRLGWQAGLKVVAVRGFNVRMFRVGFQVRDLVRI